MQIIECPLPRHRPSSSSSSSSSSSTSLRLQSLEFIIQSATQLEVTPIVKYSALSIFADRFFPSLSRDDPRNWLLHPIRESSLQLFGLVSLWISSKIHDSNPLHVNRLKSFGANFINEDHFTTRDYLEAVLNFEIGTTRVAFRFLEDLFVQLKGVATVGKIVNFEACMDIMDLLYEKEETSTLYASPISLAASVLVSSYVITVPKQSLEFPILPWVLFVTSCKEEDVVKLVSDILKHVFQPPLIR